jgi:hypothetical protein
MDLDLILQVAEEEQPEPEPEQLILPRECQHENVDNHNKGI